MDAATLMLSIAYVVPLAMAGAAFLTLGRWRRTTTFILLALPVFYVLHYQGLKALAGWPAPTEPPQEFDLIAEAVREPDRARGDPGAVFFWISTADQATPRAFELPYSKPLHEEVDRAARRRSEGKAQHAVRRAPSGVRHEEQRGDGEPLYDIRDRTARRLPAK